jgi:murein DD-endopeptidase MepM/ murein hydrolase activator NlpD
MALDVEASLKIWRTRAARYQRLLKQAQAKVALRQSQLPKVAMPVVTNLDKDTNGYNPPVHDGIDLICAPRAPLFAPCRCQVVRVSASGWWGKGAPKDPVLLAMGDGVIVLRSLVNLGPIRKGMQFAYGYAEGAVVREGEVVKPGQKIGLSGFANAWHVHFMVNTMSVPKPAVGTMDPLPILKFVKANS